MNFFGTYRLYNFAQEKGDSRQLHVQGIWRNNWNFSNLYQQISFETSVPTQQFIQRDNT